MAKRRALIFGISGQDGSYLAQLLLGKGYQVHGSSRDVAATAFGGLKALELERQVNLHSAAPTDMRNVIGLVKKVRPNEIYNLSGQNSVSLSFEQPLQTHESISQANLNILEAIRFSKAPIRFFNASSGECFGDTAGRLANEKTPFRPKSPYGVAKAAAYWMASNYRESYGVHVCSGIMFNHESPLRPERFVTRKVVAAAARIAAGSREILRLGNLEIRRDWGWAPDYVNAMWLMLQRPEPSDYVVASGKSILLSDFVKEAFLAFGLKWKNHVTIDRNFFRPSEIFFTGGNASKIRRELGWKSTQTLKSIIKLMAQAESARLGQSREASFRS